VELALAHADWTTKEYTTVRRDKLEELLLAAYEVQNGASNYATASHSGDSVVPDTSAINRCETYVRSISRNYLILQRPCPKITPK